MRGIIVAAIAAVALALGPDHSAAELRVFVTNEKSDDVTVIAAATGDVLKTIAVGKRPRGIQVSPDHKRVYVALSGSPVRAMAIPASESSNARAGGGSCQRAVRERGSIIKARKQKIKGRGRKTKGFPFSPR